MGKFNSTEEESIDPYYHCFHTLEKLMNDFSRNKHFPEKIANNLKFLNNLQPECKRHVTTVHQTKDLYKVDYIQLYDFLKFNQAEVDEIRAEQLARTHDPLALMANSHNPNNYPVFHPDQSSSLTYMQQPQPNNNYIPQPSFKTNYMQQPIPNPKDISYPTTAMNMALVLMAKTFKLNYYTPTNNNQRISSNPRNRQIAHPGNLNGYNAVQNVRNQVVQNAVQNPGIQNVGNQNGLIVVPGIANPNVNSSRNENVVATRTEVRPRRRDVAYLQTQLLITQKEEAGIQLQAEEFDLMAAAGDIDEIEEVNANCILMANFVASIDIGSAKQITTLNEEIANLNNQLSKEISIVSYLQEERKKLKDGFKTREDELFDKLIQYEKKIKELDNIFVKTGQSIQMMHILSPKLDSFYHTKQKMALGYQNPLNLKQAQQKQQSLYNGRVLLEKHDPPTVYDSEETLQLAQESCLKMKQLNKEIKPANYAKINKLSEVFVSQKAKSREEVYFSNTSKTASVSNTISKPCSKLDDEFSDDTPSVARKFLNEVAKFVRDFKYLAQEADKSLEKIMVLENENERLLRTVVSEDILSIVQSYSVVDTSNLQTKLERTSVNTKFAKPSSWENHLQPPEQNFILSLHFQKLGIFQRINPSQTYRVDKFIPNKHVKASIRTNPITVSQPHVTKKDVNSNSNGLSSTRVESTAKTRRPQPRSNTKNDRAPSASKSSCIKNKKVEKFMGTIHFGNDHAVAILRYGDLQWGNILITRVYFVEGLRHNLFSVGQFCDSDLEVAFRRNTCFVRNLDEVDILKGNRTTNLSTINLHEMTSTSPICLMARATSTKSWLWHQRLSHLTFDTVNNLAKNDIITVLPKFKYTKEHLCPSCEQKKSKTSPHKPKPVPNSK
ncbi:retrovirus-related pol polyprotein from transposon TNT 1-94 [Tanacetum coccineum]